MVAICGESHYRSAIDVYLEKRHGMGLKISTAPPKKFVGNERTEWGHILEPLLANRYAADTGKILIEPKSEHVGISLGHEPITFRHPDRAWHMGTPDRLVYPSDEDSIELYQAGPHLNVLNALTGEPVTHLAQPEKIWEGKSHGMMGAKSYDLENMTVPDDKKIQVAWYRALTGCKDADLSALIDTHIYRVFHLPHDQAVEDYLLEEGEAFWKKVTQGIEPGPDGTKGFGEYLKIRFQTHVEDMVEMPIEIAEQIASYKKYRADRKVADGNMELAKQEIQLAIGHHQGLLRADGKPAVTWKRKNIGVTSYGKLAEALRDEHGISDSDYTEAKAEHTGEPARNFLVK